MAVLGRFNSQLDRLHGVLRKKNIPAALTSEPAPPSDAVRFLRRADALATERLLVTYHRESAFTKRVEQL